MLQIQHPPDRSLVTSHDRRSCLISHSERLEKTYSYFVYGLGIHSRLPLPEFVAVSEVETDVVIELGNVSQFLSDNRYAQGSFHMTATPQEACLSWDRLGTFLVRSGRQIIVEPFPKAEEKLVRLPLWGAVLAVLLHQRGLLVLHASAVAINGEAIAFIGGKGHGKSTTAATMYARGHKLLADDVVALDLSNSAGPMVLSGIPQFKLWPEAVSSIGDDPELLPQIFSGCEKRARRVTDRFSKGPLPLKGIYTLSEGPTPEIKFLPPQEAIVELIRNSYVSRFGKRLLHGVGAATHFRQCTSLANRVPAYRLNRPNSLPLLPAVAQLVEEQRSRDIQVGPSPK
jgi:hypothetical protein